MHDKSNKVLLDAQYIAGTPEDHIDDPSLFTTAWAAMKASRGQGFDPSRLQPQHLVDRPAPSPEPIDQTLERVGQKARSVIDAKGYRASRRHVA
jgi:hypothetical protein